MIDFFDRVAVLGREGRSFAVATVVARRAPVSAHLGDRAIVFADGRMDGFVGGACSREIVRRQALEALAARRSRLVSIRPGAGEPFETSGEHVVVPMTCASEGALEVYVEPVLQPQSLIVVGATPVAEALSRLARAMDYRVVRVVDAREQDDVERASAGAGTEIAALDQLANVARERPEATAVVASQGHYDEESLEVILTLGLPYVGLVASRKRGATVRTLLEKNGVAGVGALRSPAGLDLGAQAASEVALSILAEIVQAQAREMRPHAVPTPAAASDAIDPVCGMTVDAAVARHRADLDGIAYYFCCASCRATFLERPHAYLAHR
jgi:xanthine dehydrogenase accessory factor